MQYPDQGIDGIIVLGGSYDTISHGYMSTIILEEDSEPMAVMVDLARRYPKARIIFSGGTDPSIPGPSEASIVKQYFISFGIPAERISIEERSQTTKENAQVYGQFDPSHALVTLAAGDIRLPYAARGRSLSESRFQRNRISGRPADAWLAQHVVAQDTATDNLRRVDIAVHEWLGLAVYRIRGYSSDWFAGPVPRLRDDVRKRSVYGGGLRIRDRSLRPRLSAAVQRSAGVIVSCNASTRYMYSVRKHRLAEPMMAPY